MQVQIKQPANHAEKYPMLRKHVTTLEVVLYTSPDQGIRFQPSLGGGAPAGPMSTTASNSFRSRSDVFNGQVILENT